MAVFQAAEEGSTPSRGTELRERRVIGRLGNLNFGTEVLRQHPWFLPRWVGVRIPLVLLIKSRVHDVVVASLLAM